MQRTDEDYFPIMLSFSPLLIPTLTEEEKAEFCDNCLVNFRPDIIFLVTSRFRTIKDITNVIKYYYKIPVLIELNVGGFNLSGDLPVDVLKRIPGSFVVAPLRLVVMRPHCRGHSSRGNCSLLSIHEYAEWIIPSRSTSPVLDVDDSGFSGEDEGTELMSTDDENDAAGDDTEEAGEAHDTEGAENAGVDSINPTADKQIDVAMATNKAGSSTKENDYAEMSGYGRQLPDLRARSLFVVTSQGVTLPVNFEAHSVVSCNSNPIVGASNERELQNVKAEGQANCYNKAHTNKDSDLGTVSRKRNFETAFSTAADYSDLACPLKRVFGAVTGKMSMVKNNDPEDYAAQRPWKPLNEEELGNVSVNSILKFKMINSGEGGEDKHIVLIVKEVHENSITGTVITGFTGEELTLTVYKNAMKDVCIWQQNNENHGDSQQ